MSTEVTPGVVWLSGEVRRLQQDLIDEIQDAGGCPVCRRTELTLTGPILPCPECRGACAEPPVFDEIVDLLTAAAKDLWGGALNLPRPVRDALADELLWCADTIQDGTSRPAHVARMRDIAHVVLASERDTMRINVYHHELTDRVEVVTKTADTGITFYGIRIYQWPEVIHEEAGEDDDDTGAITFWIPWTKKGGHDLSVLTRMFGRTVDAISEIERQIAADEPLLTP